MTPEIEELRKEVAKVDKSLSLLHAYLISEIGEAGKEGNLHKLLKTVSTDIASLTTQLHGSADKVGLLTRLDRIERAEEGRTWFTRALFGAVIALAAKVIFDAVH